MKHLLILFFLLPMTLGAAPTNIKQVSFFGGDFKTVKQKAKQEGKLFFVDFVANYCYLCKLMDETTFTSELLADYLKGTYIPYKVNVDDFDGYNLKQEFKIKVLPTIIVFNANGDEVGRYEESMSASKMVEVLKEYDTPENRSKGNSSVTITKPNPQPPVKKINPPKKPNLSGSLYNKENDNKDKITENKPVEPVKPIEEKAEIPENYTEEKVDNPPLKTNPPGNKPIIIPIEQASETEENEKPQIIDSQPLKLDIVAQEPTLPEDSNGLFEFGVKRHPSKGYGVQIGLFAQYGNVLKEVEKLDKLFNVPILVNINQHEGKIAYKVIVGSFKTQKEASNYKKSAMMKNNITGFVVNLANYK